MRSPTAPLPVTDEQRSVLEKLIRSRTAPHRDVQRARVLLMASDGFANTRIASEVGVSAATVGNWRQRFTEDGLKQFSTVRRSWSARGLKPHRVETFKLSNDPRFEEKLVDVVGLYLNPPENAIVLCMDEKSQIQALDRTQPSLPMKPGRAETMTHDYKRNGTTTLFAALDVLTGSVIGQCRPRHRHAEFLKFLKAIAHEVPKGLQV